MARDRSGVRRARRLLRYVRIMFPPPLALLGAAAFASIWLGLQALAGLAPLRIGARGALGAAGTVLWMLLVRLMDDLQDAPHDLRLAAAGDERYRSRPIATGRITVPEIRRLAIGTAAALLALSLLPRPGWMSLAAIGGLALTWLGFRWFFIPGLVRRAGPLAYLLRKSLAILIGAYALGAFHDQWPSAPLTWWAWPLVLAPALEVAAWETARKIRLPEDETAYGTYSKRFGWRAASLLPLLFAGGAAACLGLLSLPAGITPAFPVYLAVVLLVLVVPVVRLRRRPSRAAARLQPYAEAFGGLAHLGLIAALGLRHGLALA